MSAYPHNRRAETAGRWLGGAVRRLTFGNGRVTRMGHIPVGVRIALWAVGVAIVGLLVILAFWLALLVVFAWGAIKLLPHVGRSSDSDEPEWKWRQGLLGFGLYNQSGFRIDSHDPGRDP
ncbi:MAG: DUF3742 family protein [Steroidobacteraceae bacterium]